jgi:putative ABC transport system ATP-binding protein
MSGGQQQRVAIARALITSPSLILADEPTGNLDSRTSLEIISLFQHLNRERGITVVYVTHEQDIAEHANRIIQMRDGRVVADIRNQSPRWADDEIRSLPPTMPMLAAATGDEA